VDDRLWRICRVPATVSSGHRPTANADFVWWVGAYIAPGDPAGSHGVFGCSDGGEANWGMEEGIRGA
jgi:hypothetical protein